MVLHRVFWTKQKTQKNKRWADGFVSVNERGNMKLMSETKQVLDSDFRTQSSQIQVGDELEFDRHLATVEELCIEGAPCQDNPPPAPEPLRHHMPSTTRPLPFQPRPAPPAPPPGAAAPLRTGSGRNLLRRTAPSVMGGAVSSLHPKAQQAHVPAGVAGDWQPMATAHGREGGDAGGSSWGQQQAGGGAGAAGAAGGGSGREGGGKFTPAYFKKMKHDRLFGTDDRGDNGRPMEDAPPPPFRGSPTGGEASLGWGGGAPPPEDATPQMHHWAARQGAGHPSGGPAAGFAPVPRQSNDVLALMGLIDDPPDEEDADSGRGVGVGWSGGEPLPAAGRGTGGAAHPSPPETYVSFPSRVPLRVTRPKPAPPQPGVPHPAPPPASSSSPLATGNGIVYRAVYARKALKVKRWAPGYVQRDARGLTLLSDENKSVDSSSTHHAELSVDDEVDFAYHIALIEEETPTPSDATTPAPRRGFSLAPQAAAPTPEGVCKSTPRGSHPSGGSVCSPATALKAPGPAHPPPPSRWDESVFGADDAEEGAGSCLDGRRGDLAQAPGGQGGFFALRHVSASGVPQHVGGLRNGWGQMSQLKHSKGAGAGPPSFLSPRPAAGSAGGAGWSPFGAPAEAAGTPPSLRQEMKVHQDMDREVQQRFKAAAAQRPPPSTSSQGSFPGSHSVPGAQPGSSGLLRGAAPSGGGVRSAAAVAGIVLSNTKQLALLPVSRGIAVGDRFRSFHDYRNAFVAALEEEVTLRLRDTAQSLFQALHGLAGVESVNCRCGVAAAMRTSHKDNANKGRSFLTCGSRKCSFFKWADEASSAAPGAAQCGNISIDTSLPPPDMRLVRQRSRLGVFTCEIMAKQAYGKRQRAQQSGPRTLDNNSSFIVRPLDMDERRLSGTAKNDLWVVSSSAYFSEDSGASVTVCRSVWFGLSGEGCIELTRMSGSSMSNYSDGQKVYSLRGPNIQGEWDMMENMRNVTPPCVPLLSFLTSGSVAQPPPASGSGLLVPNMALRVDMSQVDVRGEIDRCVDKMGLNDDQTSVLRKVAHCLLNPGDATPVVLVHGVFGSGKSTLLVGIILFLVSVFKGVPGESRPRILVSSATNVAIDNVLQGLLDRGYDGFVRVGCLKRIAKAVLKYTLRETGNDEKLEKDSLKELNEMLKSTRDKTEIRQIKAAIGECQMGKLRDLKRTLGRKQVVGVTCASSGREVLAGQTFDICILDESSQFIEPLSLLPISRFSCKLLIAAGDPMQLPPTLSSPSAAETCPKGGAGDINDLSKTLFSRLVNCGVVPTMLRTQYRCHPTIGSAASDLFYSGRLINGSSEDDRKSLIKSIPPLLFVDTQGSAESRQDGGSFVNSEEARFCAWFVSSVVSKGLDVSQVGIICAYKAQVDAIQGAFESAEAKAGCSLAGVQVSTVDAFQGGERDIIIVSSCRTEALGFLKSHNRMNVAITRAKRHLVLVGCGRTLPTHDCWKELIDRARLQPGCRGVVGARDLQMDGELELEVVERHDMGDAGSDSEEQGIQADSESAVDSPEKIQLSDSQEEDEDVWEPSKCKVKALGEVDGIASVRSANGVGDDEQRPKRRRVCSVDSSPELSQEPPECSHQDQAAQPQRLSQSPNGGVPLQVDACTTSSATASLSSQTSQPIRSQASAAANTKPRIPSFTLGSDDSDSGDDE